MEECESKKDDPRSGLGEGSEKEEDGVGEEGCEDGRRRVVEGSDGVGASQLEKKSRKAKEEMAR